MPTTTNFGWTTPADTDLVKDGASAIRTLGNGIDTSMAGLKGGTTGQILSKTSNTDMAFTWIANDQGDITAVTAGTGISGGGTSGAVTITNSMATAITTNGDLIYGTGSGTFSRLGIGSSGQVLTVSSGVPAWAAAPTPSYTWTSYTPTLTQSGAVAKTVTTGKYITIGKIVHFECYLKITASGTANNNILIGLPVTRVDGNDMVGGEGYVYDASAGLYYRGIVKFPNNSVAGLFATTSTAAGYLGSDTMTAALANLDEIAIFGSYEIA